MNQNALEVIGELQDSIAFGLAEIFTDLINNVYSKMPTDLWLVTDEQYKKLQENDEKSELSSNRKEEPKEVMVIES